MVHSLHFAARFSPHLFFCACLYALLVSPTLAGIKEDVGLVTLQAERGTVPTGTGVRVAMAEASPSGNYVPMTDLPDFSGKHFEFRSVVTGNSWHATTVAQNFFGLSTSIAPGINSIELYDANPYMAVDFLHAGSSNQNPNASPQNSRVGNHSWISMGTDLNGTLDVLEREDWVVERDDYIQVVGVNNGDVNTNPLLSNGMNVIAAGLTNGVHAINTLPLAGIYTSYRTRPDIVAPMSATSFSTPVVAAASALLVQTGHNNPALSSGSYTPARFPGTTIYHAETSEVIKAALMAGAARLAFNSTDGSALLDYRAAASRQSNNGLDKRFGAGQLDVHNSMSIINGGEQNSAADGGPANVALAGFDYDPHFGGTVGANATATYDFFAGWTGQTLTASLVWNAKIDINKVRQGDPVAAATLYDLNLSLYDMTTPAPTLVASSNSDNQNSENIWTSLVGGRRYRLEVSRASGQTPFDWDYGLAWSTLGSIGWSGAITNVWSQSPSLSWIKGSSIASFLPGEHVVFGDSGVNGQVLIVGSVAPASVLVNNHTMPYTISGGEITGATGLVKRGNWQLTLGGANSYAGQTLIQEGALIVSANGALGSTAQGTVVSPSGSLVITGGINYSSPEPLTIAGQGPFQQGALENAWGENFFAGPVTASGTAGIGVGSGRLTLLGQLRTPPSANVEKINLGTLSLRGGIDWSAGSGIKVMGGTVRLEPAAGSTVAVSATTPNLTVSGAGVARINAGGLDPFTDAQNPALHVNVSNNVAGGLVLEAGTAVVNQLTGSGSTSVAAGAHLSVSRIEQSGLSIASGGRVTLRPGSGTSGVNSLTFDAIVAAPPEDMPTGFNFIGLPPTSAIDPLAGAVGAGGAAAAIPEPATMALAIGAALAFLAATACRSFAARRARQGAVLFPSAGTR